MSSKTMSLRGSVTDKAEAIYKSEIASLPPNRSTDPPRILADTSPDRPSGTGRLRGRPPLKQPAFARNDRGKFSFWISSYTKLLAVVTFLLIIAGGLVTSTKSGLSVPDWPLSYGQWMPPLVGGIKYEHTHRLIASLVGLMTLILATWMGFSESRRWVRRTAIAAFGAVVLQGILGGLTVLYLLPAPISIFHACLAQTFFALMVSLAYVNSREWFLASGTASGTISAAGQVSQKIAETCPGRKWYQFAISDVKRPLFMFILMTYFQLILGATVRHTANRYVLVSHILSGFLVFMAALIVLNRVVKNHEGESKLIVPSIGLGLMTLFQAALGMGSFIYTVMLRFAVQPQPAKVFFVTAHQSLGALLLATGVFLFLRIIRAEK